MTTTNDQSPAGDNKLANFCEAFLAERMIVRRSSNAKSRSDSKNAVHKAGYGHPLPSTHPYPGLRSFTPREARMFFGREGEADELRRRLSVSNVVVVIGGSGSGKSSLVLAGVLPRLNDVGRIPGRTGRWFSATFRPGDSPCDRIVEAIWREVCEPLLALKGGPQAFAEVLLADSQQSGNEQIRKKVRDVLMPSGALTVEGVNSFLDKLEKIDERLAKLRETLRSGKVNFLLLIDQFEELFRETVRKDRGDDIETLVNLLEFARKNPKGPLVVVATLRSEELHRCAEYDRLADIVNHGFYLIDHPRISALIEAAVRPGRQTLLDWDVKIIDKRSPAAAVLIHDGQHAPFSIESLNKLRLWVKRFQAEDRSDGIEVDRHRRHQADLLPLFQHMLRITWGTAVDRWSREHPARPTIEPSDIESWITHRQGRVTELRNWMSSFGMQMRALEAANDLDDMLEACFNTGFAITISEAITGQSWEALETWPPADAIMKERLRVLQAALVALATRDDKGNDARRPATAAEILAALKQPADAKTLQSVLSFFRARNYLHGGGHDERYDVNHEALIRNSTEYQFWLADAKKVANTLYDANAVLKTGSYEPHGQGRSSWYNWFMQRYVSFTLNRYYEAAVRISGDACRDLERIFGANAVFDPVWMAERAELPGTKDEQRAAIERIEEAWQNAHRWRVDFRVGQTEAPSLLQRVALLAKRTWTRLQAAMGSTVEERPTSLSGRELLQARIFLGILLVPSFLLAAPLLGYQFSEIWSSRDALRVLAVTADIANPRYGPANDQARGQILATGERIEELRGRILASYTHRRDLTLAAATFDVAARSYLQQIFFRNVAPPTPAGRPLSCIRFDGSDAVGDFSSISSPDSARQFALIGEKNERRLVPKFGGEIAEEPIRTTQVIAGQSIACGVADLSFLIVWSQLGENSNPLVYPVIWYSYEGRDYAKIDRPFQPRNIDSNLSRTITDVGHGIAESLANKDITITATEVDRHWVVARIEVPIKGSFEIRFARDVHAPSLRGPADNLSSCAPLAPKGSVEETRCQSNANQQSTIGIQIYSKGFDPSAITGEATRACDSSADKLCVHKVSITHSPSPRDPFKIVGTEISYLIAPPILEAGLQGGYIILKDAEGKFRSLPIEISTMLAILGGLPGSTLFAPTTTCEAFECMGWLKRYRWR